MITPQGIATLFGNAEGRDKVMKFVQYFSRTMNHLLIGGDPALKTKFDTLFSNIN